MREGGRKGGGREGEREEEKAAEQSSEQIQPSICKTVSKLRRHKPPPPSSVLSASSPPTRSRFFGRLAFPPCDPKRWAEHQRAKATSLTRGRETEEVESRKCRRRSHDRRSHDRRSHDQYILVYLIKGQCILMKQKWSCKYDRVGPRS